MSAHVAATGAFDEARARRVALVVGAAGLVVAALGAAFQSGQFFRSYLMAYLFWLGIALGCLVVLMIQYLTGGAWGLALRRILEASSRTLPLLALLFVPLVFGLPHLYAWARPDEVAADAALRHKSAYLNVNFFLARAALYFTVWVGVALTLSRWSRQQDDAGRFEEPRRVQLLSAWGLALYGLTITFASVDWVMSLDPHWYSTIYGVLFATGQMLTGFSFAVLVLLALAPGRPEAGVLRPGHYHDLGKLLLAFVMIWAYTSFSQFLLIWSGNLPEETPWYLKRLEGGWQFVGVALIVLQFALPFLLLLSVDVKRTARTLTAVAILVLVMRLVDVFWLVVPAFRPRRLGVHWLDLAAVVGLGGVWVATFLWQLGNRPLVPADDPRLIHGGTPHG